ncbi:hypothetical protein GCM10009674_28050 [Nesterenkonia xinjiangensis]
MSGRVGEVSPVGVQAAAGGLDGLVAEDALEDVEWNARISESSCSGVTKSVQGEAWQVECGGDLIPRRRAPHRRSGGGELHVEAVTPGLSPRMGGQCSYPADVDIRRRTTGGTVGAHTDCLPGLAIRMRLGSGPVRL